MRFITEIVGLVFILIGIGMGSRALFERLYYGPEGSARHERRKANRVSKLPKTKP